MGSLMYAEHRRSQRPSTLVSVYLSATILFDAAAARSLFLREGGDARVLAAVETAVVVCKLVLLVLEETPKRGLLDAAAAAADVSDEATSGVWNRSLFWWLNSTLLRGFRSLLQIEHLSSLDGDLRSDTVLAELESKWIKRMFIPHLMACSSLLPP